jgi:hypothetical protein
MAVSAVLGVALLALTSAPAALASTARGPAGDQRQAAASGELDPAAYAGEVIVATTKGDVLIEVAAGELLDEAARIRSQVADGTLDPTNVEGVDGIEPLRAGGCRDWGSALAGAWWYQTSTNGCAVIGYPGYSRVYNWANGSDVQLCVQAKSFSGGTMSWKSIGCQGDEDISVPWGNTFAHTQVRAQALSSFTGAAYRWWD